MTWADVGRYIAEAAWVLALATLGLGLLVSYVTNRDGQWWRDRRWWR